LSEGVEQQVGPQVGAELRNRAIVALIVALLGMVVYLSFRFEFSYAVGAMVALLHDVLVTAGIYVVCGRQINMQIVAILLTIIGYSVNDTIVIFDRIREDLKNSELRRSMSYREICNLSVNQTLGRTILTGLATLVAVTMMLFGGRAINDIAFCLFIGVITGMYSTVFIATPVMLLWHKEKKPVVAVKA
jgi:preprotein translocase SecF subunit